MLTHKKPQMKRIYADQDWKVIVRIRVGPVFICGHDLRRQTLDLSQYAGQVKEVFLGEVTYLRIRGEFGD